MHIAHEIMYDYVLSNLLLFSFDFSLAIIPPVTNPVVQPAMHPVPYSTQYVNQRSKKRRGKKAWWPMHVYSVKLLCNRVSRIDHSV